MKIAVVRVLAGLGDVLCAVPALARLRAAHRDAHIVYVGAPQVEAIVARYPSLIDEFVAAPGFPGLLGSFDHEAFVSFVADMRARRFDLAVQMHGSGSVSNPFTALLGAARVAGYHVPGLWCPDPATCFAFPDALSECERWVALMDRLGFAPAPAPRFAIRHDERRLRIATPYAILHPGASEPRRRWPPASFARIGDLLARCGLRVVLTGTEKEARIAAQAAAAMTSPALDLTGRTNLGEMAALIEGAVQVVTNDTGTAHLASALGTPSVVVFLTSDPARWAPAARALHVAVGRGLVDTPVGETPSMQDIVVPSVAEVEAALDRSLALAA